jgi:hypothetical protein
MLVIAALPPSSDLVWILRLVADAHQLLQGNSAGKPLKATLPDRAGMHPNLHYVAYRLRRYVDLLAHTSRGISSMRRS